MTLSGIFVRLLIDELQHRRIAPETLLSVASFGVAELEDPTFRLDFPEYGKIVGRALELTAEPLLGLFVGTRRSAAAVTLLGQIVESCSTLREAAEVLFRFQPLLVEGSGWKLEEEKGIASLVHFLPLEEREHPEYGAELCMSLIAGVLRPLRRRGEVVEVRFAHAPRGPVSRYEAILGAEVRFRAETNALRGSAIALDRRLPYGDPTLKDVLEHHAEELLATLGAASELPARIRDRIRFNPRPSAMTVEILARDFGLSSRTLRRRVGDLGISMRRIMDETLCELAVGALRRGMPIKAVAFELGYGDLSTFHRAFRRWTGLTPAQYQANRLRGDAPEGDDRAPG